MAVLSERPGQAGVSLVVSCQTGSRASQRAHNDPDLILKLIVSHIKSIRGDFFRMCPVMGRPLPSRPSISPSPLSELLKVKTNSPLAPCVSLRFNYQSLKLLLF